MIRSSRTQTIVPEFTLQKKDKYKQEKKRKCQASRIISTGVHVLTLPESTVNTVASIECQKSSISSVKKEEIKTKNQNHLVPCNPNRAQNIMGDNRGGECQRETEKIKRKTTIVSA